MCGNFDIILTDVASVASISPTNNVVASAVSVVSITLLDDSC